MWMLASLGGWGARRAVGDRAAAAAGVRDALAGRRHGAGRRASGLHCRVYVLTTGCAWRHLPPDFGVSPATAHRRFTAWTRAGVWRRLHRAVLDRLGADGAIDWSSALVDAAAVRANRGVADRGEPGGPGQGRGHAARADRRRRPAPSRRGIRRQHARLPGPAAARARHPRDPLVSRAPPTPPRDAAPGQRL